MTRKRESAAYRVPHQDFGEGVVAVIVTQLGHKADIAALREGMFTRLAGYKQPMEVNVIDQLSRNTLFADILIRIPEAGNGCEAH